MFATVNREVDKLDVIINCVGIEETSQDPLDTSKWMDSWNTNFF